MPFKILVADDEAVSRYVISNYLETENFIVLPAYNGQHVLDIFAEEKPDLVLLDVVMPKISGFEVCRILRQTYPSNQLPIIFLTSKTQVSALVEGLAVGANDYLAKPFAKEELLARIQSHLQVSKLNTELLQTKQQLETINHYLEQEVEARTNALNQSLTQLKHKHEELKKLQTQLIHTEKMASLGTLVAGVAHEINNPTNFTCTGAQNLSRKLENFKTFLFELAGNDASEAIKTAFNERFEQLFLELQAIIEGTTRIKDIVMNLRTFSRLDEAKHKVTQLVAGIQSTIDLIRPTYKHQIEFITDFQFDPQLKCYPAQLNQVFMNIIVNACQAILKRQHKQPYHPGRLFINTYQDQQNLIIQFKDNGCGIPAEVQSKIFEPFFTTKPVGEGTGLGLSISFGVIKEHHGEIMVNSIVNQGTDMRLSLPLSTEPQ